MARLFKARYFQNTILFEAPRGGDVSYIWSGLWQAKELLKKGYRWVVGNGENIRVYEDAWLKCKSDFKVDTENHNQRAVSKVSDLIIPGSKRWDV